jgi:hypothetical protein
MRVRDHRLLDESPLYLFTKSFLLHVEIQRGVAENRFFGKRQSCLSTQDFGTVANRFYAIKHF